VRPPDPSPRLGIQLSSLGTGPPGPLLESAAAAGFNGVGLSSKETAEWVDSGFSCADLRRELRARDLDADYLDPLMLWIGRGEPTFATLPDDRVLELATELEVPLVNVTIGGDYDEAEAIDAFASVAHRIAKAGMRPMVEFAPFFAVSTLQRAAIVVDGSDVPNAGILLDTWHLARSGGTPEDLEAVAPGSIHTVHLSDVPAEVPEDLLAETMNGRLYPGEGVACVGEVIRRVRTHSPRAIFTVEVYSPSLRGNDVSAFARRCYESARSLFPERADV
jgi:sugar phosphate isomerase/epimerase